ncbi:serine/threonine protein phosphatase [Desulfopila sp. IMCC35006]|uniref:metallophosphoesterase family protein n=1 Tax=Desulfopila sp. IMCC35006 TaxID=2569542 RepID=UPI0010AD62E0|nr:metallophosphoesterase family protein [Desulfopila sp. IMCC35006]TKB28536.1 serine/threonine protein phosphatase [Desulfopila sp. IMCC35006]
MSLPPPKIFAVGDIHGCHSKLVRLLDRLPLDKEVDTLVFVGDYINRGPDSRKVLDTLLQVQASYAHPVFLKGNHEQMLLEYAATGDVETLRILRTMGVESTVASYGATVRQLRDLAFFPPEHRNFLENLQFSYISGNYLFTHADINEEMISLGRAAESFSPAEQQTEAGLLSSRRLSRGHSAMAENFAGYIVVFGHSPFETPLVLHDRICIDTGAVYGNVLTAVALPELRFYHA